MEARKGPFHACGRLNAPYRCILPWTVLFMTRLHWSRFSYFFAKITAFKTLIPSFKTIFSQKKLNILVAFFYNILNRPKRQIRYSAQHAYIITLISLSTIFATPFTELQQKDFKGEAVMKKIVVILFVIALIWGVAGTVSANVITETQWCPYCDEMDFVDQDVWLPPVYIGEFVFNYQHNVNQQLEPDKEITDAWLNLLFTDDLFDGWCDYPEELWYSFDQGANWSYFGDVSFMWYTIAVDPLAVKNGILDVSLSFGRYDINKYLTQDAYLYASKFCGNTDTVPISTPEPSTLLLLGGGLLGLVVYGRKRMKK